ncbi:alpha/beta hydrolase-fold protein [Microbacterium sp. zg.Y625]|uniref:alpha/beta hydrolase family esterase n=1 Tax=Microbacterium jiangjiandongii TaxID=3049071 RepID=UPI00214BF693|nr:MULTISPECIES: PHB depolymerase family esterase [unclassified Microbacterium]MCR2791673.1 alpha/beta hydrolase-fold protein [Microbacterium sp. zg.Y625]WIM24492.1 PHB depolymerase family esterase [Microbacterium sp. zg-Y625]
MRRQSFRKQAVGLAAGVVAVAMAFAGPVPAIADDAGSADALDPQQYTGPRPPVIDTMRGNVLPVTGYYVEDVTVGDKTRTSKVYIPEDMYLRGYFTVVSVPDGWDTEEFLTDSGWIDIADERNEGLFILEADQESGDWGTVVEESAYITAALRVMEARSFYSTHGVHYIAGYGSGGAALQDYVANNPLFVASAAFIGTEDLDDIEAIGQKVYAPQPKFSEAHADPRFVSVPYNEVPVPVWFVNEDADDVAESVAYWKYANDVIDEAVDGAYGQTFHQKADSDRLPTAYSERVSQVAVREDDLAVDDRELTQQISEFLTFYTRYDNTSVFGNVLGVRPDYEEIGVDVKNLIVTEDDGQVWKRQYLVYENDQAAEAGGGAPVVYVFAGSTQPCTLFFDVTRWWEIADAYGFTVVVPCSQYQSSLTVGWNQNNTALERQADDYEYIKELTAVIDEDYNTDPGRRFAIGHSNGSMFDHGMAYRMPEYFTAIAGNGGTSNPTPDAGNSIVPMFLNMGENDLWNPYLSAPGSVRDVVSYWVDRNHVGHVDAPDSTQTGVGQLERTTLQRWENAQGIPLYMYGFTAGRDHNVSVDTMWDVWEQWFSKWSKDDTGRLYYDGEQVQGTGPDAPRVTVTPRTLGSKAYLSVSVHNPADVPVTVTVEAVFGSKTFTQVAPGATVSVSLNTRATLLPAGQLTVVSTGERDGETFTEPLTVEYGPYAG